MNYQFETTELQKNERQKQRKEIIFQFIPNSFQVCSQELRVFIIFCNSEAKFAVELNSYFLLYRRMQTNTQNSQVINVVCEKKHKMQYNVTNGSM